MASSFGFPPPPPPYVPPTPAPKAASTDVSSSSAPINCPAGQHAEGTLCVPNPTDPRASQPGGGGGQQPGDCAAQGKVWRADTKQCEFPDDRHNAGQDTCGGSLPNCPPGQDVWCDFDDATFKCAKSEFSDAELCGRQNRIRRDMGKPEKSCAELGFGGGGGGGTSGGGGGRGVGPSLDSSGFDATLRGYYNDLLNSPSRYTPEAMQALLGQITAQSAGAIRRGTRAVQQNAAARGMQRAGATGAALRDVRNTVEQQRGAAQVGVMTQKINADHQDKLDALDRAQRYLDSLRDNEYRYALMGEQRRQFDSNLALAYANLSQQRTMLNMQLQSQWDMLKANQAFWLLTQGT